MSETRSLLVRSAFAAAALAALLSAQSAGVEFVPGYGFASTNAATRDTIVFDDGTGDALYVCGDFSFAGEVYARGVARWRSGFWEAVGDLASLVPGGIAFSGTSLAVFDDGAGPALFASYRRVQPNGYFNAGVAKWNGAVWTLGGWDVEAVTTPGADPIEPLVHRLETFDLGDGPKLYLSGRFNRVGGVDAVNVARFDGTTWSALGGGLGPMPWSGLVPNPTEVRCLESSSTGGSLRLYAGGSFYVGGVWGSLASFDGIAWSIVPISNIYVTSMDDLQAFDDGTGEKLFLGGRFTVNPQTASESHGLAAYDGVSVAPIGSMSLPCCSSLGYVRVRALGVRDDGGPKLVVAGDFAAADTIASPGLVYYSAGSFAHVPRWTGSNYFNPAPSFLTFDDGEGPRYYVGTSSVDDGTAWRAVDRRVRPAINGARKVLDDGTGPKLYGARGASDFYERDGLGWKHIAAVPKWGENGGLGAAEMFDEGVGRRLFISGRMVDTDGTTPRCVLRWDGAGFSNVGGASMSGPTSFAFSILEANLGAGSRLVVAGAGLSFPGATSSTIAAWDGASWSDFGTGVVGTVFDAIAFDDGGGPALYAAGILTSAGGVPVNNIAKWNGTSWSALGSGLNGFVLDLEVYDDGSGPRLFASGSFSNSGAVVVGSIAKWTGAAWTAPGVPLTGTTNTMTVYDDGTGAGARLYAGGGWSTGPAKSEGLAVLNSTGWTPVPGLTRDNPALSVSVYEIVAAPDVDRPSLHVTGNFIYADGRVAPGITRLAPKAPKPSWSQPSPGGPTTFVLDGLVAGREYVNIFSFETPGPFALGPLFGLYASDLTPLVAQALAPLGSEPFHISATGSTYVFGPYPIPVGATLDVLAIDLGPPYLAMAPVRRHVVK
jgi:trimeric autotransporter adhesin